MWVSFGLEIDHILPMAEGGPTTIDNLAFSATITTS